jgi:hypothetical protein
MKTWLRKIKWMLVTAIAPELVVAIAAKQYFDAARLHRKYKHLNFTITHAFYAHMGGFDLAIPRHPESPKPSPEIPADTSEDTEKNADVTVDTLEDMDIYELSADDLGSCSSKDSAIGRGKLLLKTPFNRQTPWVKSLPSHSPGKNGWPLSTGCHGRGHS